MKIKRIKKIVEYLVELEHEYDDDYYQWCCDERGENWVCHMGCSWEELENKELKETF